MKTFLAEGGIWWKSGDSIGRIVVLFSVGERLGEGETRKGWNPKLVKLHLEMMRLEPRHLERGEEVEMEAEAATSRTPAKSSWLFSWNGKKRESEAYCLSQVEKSYLAFRKGGKFVMSCQELSSWDIHVILWCCKLRRLRYLLLPTLFLGPGVGTLLFGTFDLTSEDFPILFLT